MEQPTGSASSAQAGAFTTPPAGEPERQPAWHCLVQLDIPRARAPAAVATQVCELLPPLGLSGERIDQVAGALVAAVEHLRSRLGANPATPALIVNVLQPRLQQHGGWGFFVVEHVASGDEQPAVELFLYQETRKEVL